MRFPSALLLSALVLGACSPAAPPAGESWLVRALGPAAGEWDRLGAAHDRAYRAGRWEEAARSLEARIALAPRPPADADEARAVEDAVSAAFYNLACVRTRAGRHESALDALEQALRDGAGVVGFDHLVRDPDLVPLHGKARWEALVKRLSWNEEVAVTGGRVRADGSLLVVVWIGPDLGEEIEEVGPAGAVHAYPAPPYLESPGTHAWRTALEPGAQAAEKARFSIKATEKTLGAPAATRILAARGEEFVRVAWEVLLREPTAFTHAVLEGPSPPEWALLDRGRENLKTRVTSVPDAGSFEEALRKAAR